MSENANHQRDELRRYVIVLMAAALHGVHAAMKPDTVPWFDVYRLVERHSVQAMTFQALTEESLSSMPEELASKWRQDADMTLFQQVSYDVDREAILADFQHQGLSWIPLKGVLVAGYYPQPGMRSMSDQDIVVGYVEKDGSGDWRFRGDSTGERARWSVKADEAMTPIMKSHGYEELANGGREHSFAKPPLHFEMHHSLLSAGEVALGAATPKEVEYYDNPWRLAHPQGNPPCEFRFDSGDEYVFHVHHMSKHYRSSGFGLRFLADEYLYCMKYPEVIGSPDVVEALTDLGLMDFEHAVRELSVRLFSDRAGLRGPLAGVLAQLLDDVMSGGLYGSTDHRIANRLANDSAPEWLKRLRYIKDRLFLPKDAIDAYYAGWSRNGLTRFLLVFHRLRRNLREHPGSLRRELGAIWRRKD